MTEKSKQSPPPTFWQSLGRFLQSSLRLILFALVVAAVTAALFFAAPTIYNYFALPTQNNRVLIQVMQREQSRLREMVTDDLNRQSERINTLEASLAAEQEARSELETQLAQQTELAEAQTALRETVASQGQAITTLEESLDAVDEFLTDLDASIVQVEEELASPETGIGSLQRDLLLMRFNQAILTTRLFLTENNAGEAERTLDEMAPIITRLEPLTPDEQQDELAEIEAQLAAVVAALDERPFVVSEELDVLRQLVRGLTQATEN